MGTDYRSMKAWIEPLFENRSGWQRFYLDLPAHGHSSIEDWVKTSDDLLAILLAFLDSMFPKQHFALVGKSFGGYMAQGIFHKRSEQIDGLSLIAPALHKGQRSLPPRMILERDEQLLSTLDPDIKAAFETLFVFQNHQNLDHFIEEIQPGRLLADRKFLTSEWRTQGYFFSFRPFPEGSSYPQPTLIILGRQDAVCGYRDHFELLDHFPHATFTILDRAGHVFEIEQRSIVQTYFRDWLDRIEASW